MSIQFPAFVGRVDQLTKIREQAARRDETVVVNIAGAGGIGKTTTLRKIKEEYEQESNTLVTEVIDFSHTVHRVQSWVLERLTAIRPNEFPTYREKMRDIETLEPLARLYREHEVQEAFIQDYNLIAQHHRLILLFDTVELIQDTPLMGFIIELVAGLKNTMLLIAGRRNDEPGLVERLWASFGANQVVTLRLGGFTETEADLYFAQAVTPHLREVPYDLRKNIYLLSNGNPIKIGLSLEWLDQGIPLMPEITRMQPTEITGKSPEELADLQRRFEYALMDGIRQLGEPVDEVILYMAHLHKRFNCRMVEFFFLQHVAEADRTRQAAELVTELRKLPFVKYVNDDYFVLHDEMARLVTEHVWNAVEDPDKTLRRKLSQKACTFYQQELKNFPPSAECTEQQRVTSWSYQVEQMYYSLYADFRSGYTEFEELFEKLVIDQRPGLAALAVNFLREFKDEAGFSELLAGFVDGYYEGGVLLALQKFGEAEKVLVQGEERLVKIISKPGLSPVGSLDRHLGERRYIVYHQLGFCYRSMGNWERAIQNYNQALNLALEAAKSLDKQPITSIDQKKLLMAQIAETLNSLSNVHRLAGNFHEARLLCQTSILMRQQWDSNQVARSQYVMAMILWEMGATAEAMRYLRAAEQSCPPTDDTTQALIKKYQGYIRFRAGLPQQAMPLLEQAETVFRQRGQFSELADVLNLRSRIYRDHPDLVKDILADQDHMVLAKQVADEAYEIAQRIGDEFRQAECLMTRAFHYYHWLRLVPDRHQEYLQIVMEAYEAGIKLAEGKYYRLLSFFSSLRGDIAFDEHNYDLAFEQYAQQCAQATRFKRAVYERAIDMIGDRLRELAITDKERVKHYADFIVKFWGQKAQLNVQYHELIDEIKEIKTAVEERKKLEKWSQQYQNAFLQGKWGEAVKYCNLILDIPSLRTDVNKANTILAKIRAIHRQGNLSEARRLAKVVLQIGTDLNAPTLIGNAHLWLARILWDATNTAEAAAHLVQAERAFVESNDKVGLTRVKRQRSYTLHRTGFFQEIMSELVECSQAFEQYGLDSELADVLNVMSRIMRTDKEPDYDQALEYTQCALHKAQAVGDSYRIAECYLSQAILAHRQEDYHEVLRLCDNGLALLHPETHLLLSVYRGIQGNALLQLGLAAESSERNHYMDQAFEAFVFELVEATESKPARLVRALDLIYGILMHLPVEEMQKYTQFVKGAWQRDYLAKQFPIVTIMCEQAIRFRPYVQFDQSRKEA